MRAGPLRHRATVQHKVSTTGAQGSKRPTWVTFLANVPVEYIPLRTREFVAANQQQSELTAMFRMRRRTDITSDMRIVLDGVPFDIVGDPIDVKGRRVLMELNCKNGVRDGQ